MILNRDVRVMYCKKCGKEIEDGSKFCIECGERIETEFSENSVITQEKKEDSCKSTLTNVDLPLILNVSCGGLVGSLKFFSDRMEFVYKKKKNLSVETYHYYNIINVSADNALQILNLVIETRDSEKMFFTIENEKSYDVYEQKAKQINEIKGSSPSFEELGFTLSNMDKELNENKKKRKSEIGKKIATFFTQYKNFNKLSLMNKIVHIALPLIIVVLTLGFWSGDSATDEDYMSSAKTAVSSQLKAPSTASYSDVKIVDKDDYGRVLVTMAVDAQNGFGAYVHSYYAVVIKSYDTDTDKFVYYPNAIQRWTTSGYEEIYIEAAKDAVNWGEPLEED